MKFMNSTGIASQTSTSMGHVNADDVVSVNNDEQAEGSNMHSEPSDSDSDSITTAPSKGNNRGYWKLRSIPRARTRASATATDAATAYKPLLKSNKAASQHTSLKKRGVHMCSDHSPRTSIITMKVTAGRRSFVVPFAPFKSRGANAQLQEDHTWRATRAIAAGDSINFKQPLPNTVK